MPELQNPRPNLIKTLLKNITQIASALILMVFVTNCQNTNDMNGLSEFTSLDSLSNFAPELWIPDNTFKGSFSDDLNTFYFFRKEKSGVEKYIPYESHFKDGSWEAPTIASYYDENYSYTYQLKEPKTNRLFFISDLRIKSHTSQNPNYNFWHTVENNGTHSQPEELGYENLIYNYNSQPCITNKGTIFFTSDLPDWSKTLSYKMELQDEKYLEPVLFDPVNSWRNINDWTVYEFCVSPDESFIIVCISDKTEEVKSADLYISYSLDGKWTLPEKMSYKINTDEAENFPAVTIDGKYLIFTRAFSEFKIVPTSLFMN